jgi:hypothetical protein
MTDPSLATLLDERAIALVMQRYCHAMDYGPESAWVSCFTPDGVFDVRNVNGESLFRVDGEDNLAGFIAEYPKTLPKFFKHLYLSPIVDLDGDTAHVESYVLVIWCDEGKPAEVSSFGKVNDVFVRTTDGWRIKERVALTEAMPVDPAHHLAWSES